MQRRHHNDSVPGMAYAHRVVLTWGGWMLVPYRDGCARW